MSTRAKVLLSINLITLTEKKHYMSDNPHTDVIKDLGIYAIKATVTLNAGAFGVILANTQHLRNIQ